MKSLFQVPPYCPKLLAQSEQLRKKLNIPELIDSPYFVARFLRANHGDETLATQKIQEFLTHRHTLGYDQMTDLQILREFPLTKACFERFSISILNQSVSSNNCHVFVQKMEGSDIKEIMKVIPLSYVLHSYFCLQEMFCRCLAKTEMQTGKPSGVICILDLTGLNLSDFINPLSGPAKLARLVVKIWSEYFSENMIKLVIVNPPAIVSLMFKVTRLLMDEETAQRLSFLNSVQELQDIVGLQTIPEVYGGQCRDDSGFADPPETLVNPPKPVIPSEYRKEDEVWFENGYLKSPSSKHFNVKGKHNYEIVKKCTEPGQSLIWNFTTSNDIQFEIVRLEGGKEVSCWPKITLTSLKLPEYGVIKCVPGDYIVRFNNPSSTWFPVKIDLACEMK